MYSIDKNTVYYDGKPVFEAPGEIRHWSNYKDDLIINFFVPYEDRNQFSEDDVYRNVIRIDQTGAMIWRIQGLRKGHTFPGRPRFQSVWIDQKGTFGAYDGGWEYQIDPETGKILDAEFTK